MTNQKYFYEIHELKETYDKIEEWVDTACLTYFKDNKNIILRNIPDAKEYLENLIEDESLNNDEKEDIQYLIDEIEFIYDHNEIDSLRGQEELFRYFELSSERQYYEVLDIGIFQSSEDTKKKAKELGLKRYNIKKRKF